VNRSLSISAGLATIALASVLSTKTVISAQTSAPAKIRMPATTNQKQPHRLAVQIDVNDPAVMNLALNNVNNLTQYYAALGQKVNIEVIAFGPGLHMLRDDTSPVKARIKSMSEATPHLAFSACGNTRENMAKNEAKDIPLISEAKLVKSGVVRLMELQERGWSYLRP
jgi:intracellular sulfur oxidation DsrE/DsrF family protein